MDQDNNLIMVIYNIVYIILILELVIIRGGTHKYFLKIKEIP